MTVVLIAFSAIVTAAGGALWFLNEHSSRDTDPVTLCIKEGNIADATVLLMDMSDRLGRAQAAKLRNDLARLQREVPRFGLIAVYALDGDVKNLIRPVLELCNPGDGSDLNSLYQNPALARQKWEREFARKLEAELSKVLALPPMPASPILEAVQAVAVQTFAAPRLDGARKRLVVVSDLMQYVPGKMDQYAETPQFAAFKSTPYYNAVKSDLRDVEVTIFYIVRPDAPQRWPAHRLFWEEYFTAQGATVERIEPLHGAR